MTLRGQLEERLSTLALPDTWEGQQVRERAEKMVDKLAVVYQRDYAG